MLPGLPEIVLAGDPEVATSSGACGANPKGVAAPQRRRSNRHDRADAERLARAAQHASLDAPSEPPTDRQAELKAEKAAFFARIRAENAERDRREAIERLESLSSEIAFSGKPTKVDRAQWAGEIDDIVALLTEASAQ